VPTFALVLIGWSLGVGFAWCASEELRQHPSTLNTQTAWVVVLYSLLVYAPAAAYLISFHGDWSLSYWVQSGLLPRGALTLLIAICTGAPFVGLLVGGRYARARRGLPLLYLGAAPLAVCMLGALLSLPRLLVSASTVQYRDDFGTRSIAGSPLGYAVLGMAVVVGLASVWTANALRNPEAR
jgi:hypothetical protein